MTQDNKEAVSRCTVPWLVVTIALTAVCASALTLLAVSRSAEAAASGDKVIIVKGNSELRFAELQFACVFNNDNRAGVFELACTELAYGKSELASRYLLSVRRHRLDVTQFNSHGTDIQRYVFRGRR
jgi:hypothetical protein